jgi:TonB family protein
MAFFHAVRFFFILIPMLIIKRGRQTIHILKCMLVVCVWFLSIAMEARGQSTDSSQESKGQRLEAPLQYPGGLAAFHEYIGKQMRYPLASQLRGHYSGKVTVKFVIDTAGQVTEAKVIKGIDKYYDKEVLRVLTSSPKWIPGMAEGKKVKVHFEMPINFRATNADSTAGVSLEGANVLLYGNLLERRDIERKVADLYLPVWSYDAAFSQALLGPQYNRPLVIVSDPHIDQTKITKNGLGYTLDKLKAIDSTKFQLHADGKIVPFHQWRKYLSPDSTSAIWIYGKEGIPLQNEEHIGAVMLLSEDEVGYGRDVMAREVVMKTQFMEWLAQYRAGKVPLREELIYIDDYHFNARQICDSLDTALIHRVLMTPAEQVRNSFTDDRKKGYIQLYTKTYSPNREEVDRKIWRQWVDVYKKTGKEQEGYIIFLDNTKRISFRELCALPETTILQLNILSKERANAFFGAQEQQGIIYVRREPSK